MLFNDVTLTQTQFFHGLEPTRTQRKRPVVGRYSRKVWEKSCQPPLGLPWGLWSRNLKLLLLSSNHLLWLQSVTRRWGKQNANRPKNSAAWSLHSALRISSLPPSTHEMSITSLWNSSLCCFFFGLTITILFNLAPIFLNILVLTYNMLLGGPALFIQHQRNTLWCHRVVFTWPATG